jgi:hypothetical protein
MLLAIYLLVTSFCSMRTKATADDFKANFSDQKGMTNFKETLDGWAASIET